MSLTGASRAATLGAPFQRSPAQALEGNGMTCPRCQQENPAEAHFCMKCGTALTLVCAKVQHRAADGRSLLFPMRATG